MIESSFVLAWLLLEDRNWTQGFIHTRQPHLLHTWINYLCTYDLYGPARNVFDAGRWITWGRWGGGLALEIKSFVGLCEIARADRRVLFGAHKTRDFQRQPPPFPTLSIRPHQKHYAQGRINHRRIGGFMNTRIRVSDPDPNPHGSALIWAAGSGSGSAYKLRIRIRIQEGKNDPKK